MNNILSGIITSKLKIKMIIRFFMNPESSAYLRELSNEFDVSSNAVRTELNQFTESGLIKSEKDGRKVLYKANKSHPLFPELSSMTKKVMGIDKVIESIITRLGKLELAYLLDDYAIGKDSGIIDLLLIGNIDNFHLHDLTKKTERYLNRKIRHLVLEKNEFEKFKNKLEERPHLLIWQSPEN
ncbi:MAG: winged helix-turn-helix domain-containing protein [Desulforegulaceae bacterium]|nr:winged helix-turn-helix domain-containing protein [Desulforegulaceae bacterium]